MKGKGATLRYVIAIELNEGREEKGGKGRSWMMRATELEVHCCEHGMVLLSYHCVLSSRTLS